MTALRPLLSKVLLLVSLVALIGGIEHATTCFFGDQTLTPLLSILCCAALIFLGSPRLILAAIPLFALVSYLLIMDVSKYPLIRTSTMVVGGLLAYWACCQKTGLENQIFEVETVLSKIRIPWILCDRSGNIRRMSTPAEELAQANFKDLEGTSFFAKFSAGTSKGELIRKFLKTADSRTPVEKLSITIATTPARTLDASFIPILTREGPGILVILSPSLPA